MKADPQMTAEQLRDLRLALLVHLYRVQPLGRTAIRLHQLIQKEISRSVADVNAQLVFLRGKNFVFDASADVIAPGLDPFWFITSPGMSHCEERRVVWKPRYTRYGGVGNIGRLPWGIRQTINEKLRDNRMLSSVAQWIFEQTAPEDLPELGIAKGDLYAKIYAPHKDPLRSCCTNLCNYRQGPHYRAWLADEKHSGLIGSVISNLNAIEAVSETSGGNSNGASRFALSVIIDKLEKVTGDEAKIEDLTNLTKAVTALNNGIVASRKTEIDLRKLELLEKKAADAESVTSNVKLTPEEKEQRYKEIFGIA